MDGDFLDLSYVVAGTSAVICTANLIGTPDPSCVTDIAGKPSYGTRLGLKAR